MHQGSSPLARGLLGLGAGVVGVAGIIPARAGFTRTAGSTGLTSGDHPRSRGVYPAGTSEWAAAHGSSPLARGLRDVGPGPGADVGIIPARAGFTHQRGRLHHEPGDHPRSRGVYRPRRPPARPRPGSSPLARGLRDIPHEGSQRRRIIPARAGFTPRARPSSRSSPDHPRSRGVYRFLDAVRATGHGSSPLARGLRVTRVTVRRLDRIIPARAGFTGTPSTCPPTGTDHPRSRGVYARDTLTAYLDAGSSPLARGLRQPGDGRGGRSGIIPARAGFTRSACPTCGAAADHPRSRGVYFPRAIIPITYPRIIPARAGFTGLDSYSPQEYMDHPRSRGVYVVVLTEPALSRGSSPLARGLPLVSELPARAIGIIPARAGFTAHEAGRPGPGGDHPRSRGVYRTRACAWPTTRGSSPLARGLRPLRPRRRPRRRIIPARAGFTRTGPNTTNTGRDHPRSRGVYPGLNPSKLPSAGSSPLARGLLGDRGPRALPRRIIPARAGFTLADRWYPNEPVVYQTPAAFTADPGPAPPGRRSVAVVRGGASPLPDVLDATRPPRVFPAPVREPLRHAQTSGSVIRLEADRVDRADPHRHERGDDPRQGSDPGCRHQSDERGGHGEGRVVRHRDI